MVRRLALAAVALILLSLAGGDMAQSMSPLQRTILGKGNTTPTAYWTLEGGADAGQAGSAVTGGVSLATQGTVTFGSDGPTGAASAPSMPPTSRLTASLNMPVSTAWTLAYWTKIIHEDPLTSPALANVITTLWRTSSTTQRRWVVTSTTDGSFSASAVNIFDSTNTITGTAPAIESINLMDGEWHFVAVVAEQDGADVDVTLRIDDTTDTETAAGVTLLPFTYFQLGNYSHSAAELNVETMSVSHAAVWASALDTTALDGLYQAGLGYAGELATDRFARLCEEAGAAYDVAGTSAQRMGPQATAELMPLLRDCEAVDGGVIVERRTGELALDSLDSRLNIATSLTLDYGASTIDDIAPTDDDLIAGNDWTIARSGGGSARVEQTTGPMGTDPVTGAGPYEKSATLNLYEDEQAVHQAGWRVWL